MLVYVYNKIPAGQHLRLSTVWPLRVPCVRSVTKETLILSPRCYESVSYVVERPTFRRQPVAFRSSCGERTGMSSS